MSGGIPANPRAQYRTLGIIAQLDMSEPRSESMDGRTPLSAGGMIRHRVRRQLPGAFLAEFASRLHPNPLAIFCSTRLRPCFPRWRT